MGLMSVWIKRWSLHIVINDELRHYCVDVDLYNYMCPYFLQTETHWDHLSLSFIMDESIISATGQQRLAISTVITCCVIQDLLSISITSQDWNSKACGQPLIMSHSKHIVRPSVQLCDIFFHFKPSEMELKYWDCWLQYTLDCSSKFYSDCLK